MISIVIPVYNKEAFIKNTINSVLSQTYTQFEIILINDGSTDKSLAIIESFEDNRIKVLTIPNSGVSVARNTGVEMAIYNYIAFLDADDFWAPSFLEEMASLITKYPGNNVFGSGRSTILNNVVRKYNNSFLPEEGKEGIIDYIQIISSNLPPINSSNVVISKQSLFKAGLFKEGQKHHEDHDLWLRICAHELIVFYNKNLSFYRKGISNSASRQLYLAEDFLLYLKTILKVKGEISAAQKPYFEKYYDRYILISIIKFQKDYTREETKAIMNEVKQIVSPVYLIIIKIVLLLPSKGLYNMINYFRK
ncbi:MAG: glycosyltransferase family A protein [Ginsengibacter sp.]